MATITDVAARAGCSIKTVSRVLNNEAHVRDEMRDRILRAAMALHYVPNPAAKALASSRAYLIGLVYDSATSSYLADTQLGAIETCRKNGYHLLVEKADARRGVTDLKRILANVRLGGVILTPPVCDQAPVLDLLEASNIPFVRIGAATFLDRGPRVDIDDRQAGYAMTAHLLSLGHQRIGFIRGPREHVAAAQRYEGYIDALREAGIEVEPGWVKSGDFTFRSGVGAAMQLLDRPECPTAVFASNDDMALGVMAAATRMGLSIPENLSVAGFDDAPIAQVVWPQLTTIRQPMTAMAALAAELLIGRGNDDRLSVRLDFELLVRGSTGAIG